jgi:hypothetical protein
MDCRFGIGRLAFLVSFIFRSPLADKRAPVARDYINLHFLLFYRLFCLFPPSSHPPRHNICCHLRWSKINPGVLRKITRQTFAAISIWRSRSTDSLLVDTPRLGTLGHSLNGLICSFSDSSTLRSMYFQRSSSGVVDMPTSGQPTLLSSTDNMPELIPILLHRIVSHLSFTGIYSDSKDHCKTDRTDLPIVNTA